VIFFNITKIVSIFVKNQFFFLLKMRKEI